MSVLLVIGRGLDEAFLMFWQTLWALVLGFALSGMVQAFVSRGEMRRMLGDRRPATLGRAAAFGAASSSCSYAASALAKSLFARGADFTTSMVFMVASTNLVVELGLVLWLLLGWQFTLAEYVGGAIMIALLAVAMPRLIPRRLVDAARDRLSRDSSDATPDRHDNAHGHGAPDHGRGTRGVAGGAARLRTRLGDRGRWADAAGYTISDLTMLRREMLVGFVVAGLLAAAVPSVAWRSLFVTGHGVWSSVENAVLGPFLALISFVCSIGNVPLAVALWHGGIGFGGVVAFVFADLVTLPLVLIYRRYYGTGVALRLLGVFWLVMSAAGLAVEYLFAALHMLPTSRPATVGVARLSWDPTTFLDIAALALFATIYWVYRHRDRLGGGAGYAKDPVCGMQVEIAHAPAVAIVDGQAVYFCSDRCRARFLGDRDSGHPPGRADHVPSRADDRSAPIDPVCGMTVDPRTALRDRHAGGTVYFCGPGCRDAFRSAHATPHTPPGR